MKILLYTKHLSLIKKSGVGRAILHQTEALKKTGIPFTTNTKEDYDIVHINTVFPSSYMMSRVARIKGKKVIYHAHSTAEDFRNSFCFSNLLAPFFKKWITTCYNSSDLLITPTTYSKGLLESYGIQKPIVAISNGVDLGFYQKESGNAKAFRKQYGFKDTDKIIVGVGLCIERKGILDFVELACRMPDYKFIWFGQASPHAVPSYVRKALETKADNLTFAGYVKKEDLRDAYSGSSLFFFPTYEETEGIVLLEALSMKIPILIRDIPIYQSLENKNVLYKANTVDSFETYIHNIINHTLPDLTDAGYAIVAHKSIEDIGYKLYWQYKLLLAPSTPIHPSLLLT